MAPIMFDLSHAESNGQRRFVNYRDMSVQQLGSIYERLLESASRCVTRTARYVVRPNSYARKDSGSFFTPQELVDLIIDRTLKPLAEERLTAFETESQRAEGRPAAQALSVSPSCRSIDPAEAVLDLKVLDPAMGSGHFLVTAVDFLSDFVAELIEYVPAVPEWLDGEYESPVVGRVAAIRDDILRRASESDWVIDESLLTDQAIIRRMVLKRCIYGVDKNPLTVELAKGVALASQLHGGRSTVVPRSSSAVRRLADRDEGAGQHRGVAAAERALRQQRDPTRGERDGRDAAHRGDVGRRRCRSAGVGVAVPGGGVHDGADAGPA